MEGTSGNTSPEVTVQSNRVGLTNIPTWAYSRSYDKTTEEHDKDFRRRTGRLYIEWKDFKRQNGSIIIGAQKRWPDATNLPHIPVEGGYAITVKQFTEDYNACKEVIKNTFVRLLNWEVETELRLGGEVSSSEFYRRDGLRILEQNFGCPLCEYEIPGAMTPSVCVWRNEMSIFSNKINPNTHKIRMLEEQVRIQSESIDSQEKVIRKNSEDRATLQESNDKLQSEVNKLSRELAEIHQAKALVASLRLIREYLVKDTPEGALVNMLNQQRMQQEQLAGLQRPLGDMILPGLRY